MTSPWLKRIAHAWRHPCAVLPGAPVGVIPNAREWVAQRLRLQVVDVRRGPAAAWWDVDAPVLRALPPPRTASGVATPAAAGVVCASGTALCHLTGARVLGAEGVVISPDNHVFAEFTYADDAGDIGGHSVFRRRRFPKAQRLAGTYATLVYPSAFAYFHWVMESLPRLRLLQNVLTRLDGVFVPGALEPQMRESLLAMGLRDGQLIGLDMQSHFEPEVLLVPHYNAGLNVPAWMPAYLRGAVLGARPSTPPTRHIYISRADAQKRRVTNEEQLQPLLQARGYEIVRLRELDFRAQAGLFASAARVVAPHGAGLVNVAFCQPGARVLEMLPSPSFAPHVFHALATAAGAEYWCLHGRQAVAEVHGDFDVAPEDLARTLEEMDRDGH